MTEGDTSGERRNDKAAGRERVPARPRIRRPYVLLGIAALGGLMALLALPLVPSLSHRVGPAEISTRVHLGLSRTVVRIPPVGTVAADTHLPPLTVEHSLSEIDVVAVADEIGRGDPPQELIRELADGLRAMAVVLVLKLVAAGAILGAITAALLPHRRWSTVTAGALGGGVLVGAVVLLTGVTFDIEAFEQPRFTGALTRAPVVIEAIGRGEITLSDVRSRYETAAARLSELLALVARPNRDPRIATTAILHISDIHSNPLGIDIARELAGRFDVDAVVDTGDLTNFGLTIEATIGRLIRRFRVPYYFVPGNHDSTANERALARIPNLIVLDGDQVQIGAIDILGWRDPTYTNWNNIPVDEANEIRIEEGDAVLDAVERLQPDVLAVHDARMAQASIGEVPLVLAGHDHEQGLEETDGTRVLKVGSTGATGFKFFVESERDYEAQVVYFRGDDAVAVDYIRFKSLGEDFEIERTVFDDDG